MLRSNEGFFLSEMLIAMAALLMAVSIILPYSVWMSTHTAQLRKQSDAMSILYDELMYIKIIGDVSEKNAIVKNGTPFQIIRTSADGQAQEVCVRYETEEKKEVCGIVE